MIQMQMSIQVHWNTAIKMTTVMAISTKVNNTAPTMHRHGIWIVTMMDMDLNKLPFAFVLPENYIADKTDCNIVILLSSKCK